MRLVGFDIAPRRDSRRLEQEYLLVHPTPLTEGTLPVAIASKIYDRDRPDSHPVFITTKKLRERFDKARDGPKGGDHACHRTRW